MSAEAIALLCLVVAIWASAIYFLLEDFRFPDLPGPKESLRWRKGLLLALIAAGLLLHAVLYWIERPAEWIVATILILLLLYLVSLPFIVYAIRGERLLNLTAFSLWLLQFTFWIVAFYGFYMDW